MFCSLFGIFISSMNCWFFFPIKKIITKKATWNFFRGRIMLIEEINIFLSFLNKNIMVIYFLSDYMNIKLFNTIISMNSNKTLIFCEWKYIIAVKTNVLFWFISMNFKFATSGVTLRARCSCNILFSLQINRSHYTNMTFLTSWEEFAKAAERLYLNDPQKVS